MEPSLMNSHRSGERMVLVSREQFMPIINGKYYANPAYGKHIEFGTKPSIARELKKEKNQPKNIKVEGQFLLDLIPVRKP
jgi:hypothetical protein